MVAKRKIEDPKESNSYSITRQQSKIQLTQQDTVELMEIRWNENYGVLVKEQIQSQMGKISLQRDRLDDEIKKLWNLMHLCKRRYNKVRKIVQCEFGLKVNNSEGKNNGELQHKVWNPRRVQPVRCDDSKDFGQLQTKFWDPGKIEAENA